MPVGMLEEFDDLDGEGDRLASVDQVAAAIHNHVSNHLLAIAQFFD